MKGIITADWHLRKDRPRCRLDDDWMETQRKAIRFIINEANERHCDIYHCGDIFNSSIVPPEVLNMLLEELKKLMQMFLWLPGNHDLPYHSLELILQASIYPLLELHGLSHYLPKRAKELYHQDHSSATPYGQEPEEAEIMFMHKLVFPDSKKIPPNSGGIAAEELHDLYPSANWVFTGDNHTYFHWNLPKDFHVLNPGCLLRQSADMIDYKPRICYVDTEKNLVESVFIPDTGELVTDEYLKKEEERENRVEAFIEKIHSKTDISLSFTENIGLALKDKSISTEVKNTVKYIFDSAKIKL